jgi:pentose-5-phosphate-3-epimerase
MINANDPARGIVRGAALNPGTPLEVLEPLQGEF